MVVYMDPYGRRAEDEPKPKKNTNVGRTGFSGLGFRV